MWPSYVKQQQQQHLFACTRVHTRTHTHTHTHHYSHAHAYIITNTYLSNVDLEAFINNDTHTYTYSILATDTHLYQPVYR